MKILHQYIAMSSWGANGDNGYHGALPQVAVMVSTSTQTPNFESISDDIPLAKRQRLS